MGALITRAHEVIETWYVKFEVRIKGMVALKEARNKGAM